MQAESYQMASHPIQTENKAKTCPFLKIRNLFDMKIHIKEFDIECSTTYA